MCSSGTGALWTPLAQAALPLLTPQQSSQPHPEAGDGFPTLVVGQPSLGLPLQGHCLKLELLDGDVGRPHLHTQEAGDISGRPMLWSIPDSDSVAHL